MSVISGSSMGHSEGSMANKVELHSLKPGQEDDFGGDDSKSVLTGLFGVLYTVSKEKSPTWQFVTFRSLLDWLQLFLIVVSPQFGFNGWINEHNKAWQVFSFIQLNQFLSGRGYTVFSALLYVFAAGLLIIVVLGVWVGHSFQQNRFDHVWPITTMRWFGFIFFQLLDIASLTLFLIPLDCQLYGRAANVIGHNQEFPDVYCWAMPHLIQVFVSVICLIVFVVLATLFIMAEMELNLATKNLIAMAHSKTEVYGFILKTLMTFCSVFLANYQHMAIAELILSIVQVWLYAYWVPHYNSIMNHVRVGTYMSIFWTCVMLVAQTFHPNVIGAELKDYRSAITLAMWGGQIPFFFIGCVMSYYRLRFFHVTVIDRFLAAPPGTKAKNIYRFSDAREVEIVGRVCRKWTEEDDDILEPAAIELAEMVMKAGTTLLPGDPFMIILYSSFLIDVQVSCQSGYTLLQTAKKADPSLLEKFAIFSREQQHTQNKSSGAGSGQQTDLISYVEFERNYRLAKKVHRDALVAMRNFWSLLPHSIVQFETLANAIATMDTAIRAAERVYRMVLQRHANNVKLVRLYAKFLELVKHDPWSASKWFAEADKLEQQAEDIRNSNVFGDLVVDDPHVRAALQSLGNTRPGQDVPAVIIMDAHAIIQMTNPTAADMFGYDKTRNEMVGRNVNILIPPPFSEHHTTYVRSFVVTGKETILNKQTEFVALHKERHVFPIQLTVSKVSGIGEDTLLMGIIEAIVPEPESASLWILENGQMLSVDEAYTDWFAYKPSDVVGGALATFVPKAGDVERILRALARKGRNSTEPPITKPGILGVRSLAQQISLPRPDDTNNLLAIPNAAEGDSRRSTLVDSPSNVEDGETLIVETRAKSVSKMPLMTMASTFFGRPEQHAHAPPPPVRYEQRLLGVQFQHKYADASDVDVSITCGGIGAYKFFQLTLRHSPRQPVQPHMFVSDKKGRIMHITRGLSAFLGSSPKVLMANDMQHAVEALLPQPFAQLHRKLQTCLPVTAPPPYSCRSGLSVLLATSTRTMQHTLPFRMRLQKRELHTTDEPYHLVLLEQRSMEQALAERRLTLLLDEHGTIKAASDTPISLFGFRPSKLVGSSISTMVDELASSTEGADDVRRVLLMLASRDAEVPGTSWRVSVLPPAILADQGGLQSVMARKSSAAIMSVTLKAAAPSTINFDSAANDTPRSSSTLTSANEAMLEVCLWRSDLVTGVIEIDSGGQIINSHDLPLYPPGLLLGTSSEEMRGSHIARYLPMLGGQSMTALFDPNGLGAALVAAPSFAFEDPSKKRSNLKGMNTMTTRNDKAGPLHYVRVRHQGDGAEVQLTVQAVRKESARAAGALYLIIHPHVPTGGRPDLIAFLEGGGLKANNASAATPNAMMGSPNVASVAGPYYPWVPKGGSRRSSIQLLGPSTGRESLDRQRPADAHTSSLYDDNSGWSAIRRSVDVTADHMGSPHRTPSARRVNLDATPVQLSHAGSLDHRSRFPQLSLGDGLAMPTAVAKAPALLSSASNGQEPALDLHADPNMSLEVLEKSLMANSPRMPDLPHTTSVAVRNDSAERHMLDSPSADAGPTRIKSVQFGAPSPREDLVNAWVQSSGAAGTPSRFAAPSPAPAREGDVYLDTRDSGRFDEDDEARESETAASSEDHGDEEDGDGVRRQQSDSDIDEAVTSGVDSTDFRRGTRFKKLARMLSSNQVQKDMWRFRNHIFALVVVLAVVHVAVFATMYILVTSQSEGVVDLHNAGTAARKAGEVYFAARALDLLYTGQFLPGLTGLESAADLPAARANFLSQLQDFKTFHHLYYLGPTGHRRLTSAFGLGAIWDEPNLPVTEYREPTYDLDSNGNILLTGGVNGTVIVTPVNVTMSLWELGNAFLSSAETLYQNADEYNATHGDINSWAHFKFLIHNGPGSLTDFYLDTLDIQVELVLQGAAFLNQIQVIVMVIEGLVLMVLVAAYVWFLATLVGGQRFNMYNIFMVLPQGLVRGLATKRLDLDGEDGEDDDDDGGLAKQADSAANPNVLTSSNIQKNKERAATGGDGGGDPALGEGEGGGGNARRMSYIKLSVPTNDELPDTGVARGGIWGAMAKVSAVFRFRSNVVPGGKRRMQPSLRAAVLITAPFVCWGLAIIIFNVIATTQVQAISAPIATFNMVNFVMVRHKRELHLVQELCTNQNLTINEDFRSAVREKVPNLVKDYTVMLYGAEALPNETSKHFTLATEGLAYAPGNGVNLLFYTTDCLCGHPSQCKGTDSVYYADTHGGVDRMMRKFIKLCNTVVEEVGAEPFLTGEEYAFMWMTKPDMVGGLAQVEVSYQAHVEGTYKQVVTLHTIELVFTLLILLAFLIFLMRPFLSKTKNETRRIAELLSQLPPEVDVEGLLQRALTPPQVIKGVPTPADDEPALPVLKPSASMRMQSEHAG